MIGFSTTNAADLMPATATAPMATPGASAIAKVINFATMPRLATDSSLATWARAAAVAALYAAAMVVCILIGRYGAQVTPIWVPSAILAWALLTSPPRAWPILVGLTVIAHLIGSFIVGDQFGVELIYLAANIACPLLFAALMRRKGEQLEFEDRGEVVRFLIYGGVFAPALSVAIAVAPMLSSGSFNVRFAAIWFLAEGLSLIVFLPIFKIVASNGWRELLAPGLRARAFALLGVLVASHGISAFLPANLYSIFTILLIPYLIYVAFDAGMTAARAAIALSSVSMFCVGLFAVANRVPDPQGLLLSLQIYVLATVACVLPIAAALEERHRLYEAASEALQDAQEAWGGLIAAEAQFRLVADNASECILRLRSDGEILFASPAWKSVVADPESLHGVNISSLVREDGADRLKGEISKLVSDGSFDRPHHWQLNLRDMNGVWRLYDVRATLITADEFVAVLRQVQE
jgi:integral membrane sensor domain MASE1